MKVITAFLKVVVILAVAGAAAWGILHYLSGKQAATSTGGPPGGGPGGGSARGSHGAGGPPTPVLAAVVKTEDVPVLLTAVGSVQAFNNVTVQAQVSGQLQHVYFTEGQEVKKGDVLAQIDPSTFKATYDAAVAKKAQDVATLANDRLDLIRYTRLAAQDYGSKQQADTQKATVAEAEALVANDQAEIESAAATLGYATITSPIDGRTGIRQIDQGNIITTTSTTGLVTIAQLKPISVLFTLPEQNLAAALKAKAAGSVTVKALASDGKTVIDTGTLAVIDNTVDTTTGTVKLKATFPNDKEALWPGAFVNVSLEVDTLKNALVVPSAAVQQGPNGSIVYLVGENNTVSTVPVAVTQQDDALAVLASGVHAGETVVTSGFFNLADGSKVKIGSADEPVNTTPTSTRGKKHKPGTSSAASSSSGSPSSAGIPAP